MPDAHPSARPATARARLTACLALRAKLSSRASALTSTSRTAFATLQPSASDSVARPTLLGTLTAPRESVMVRFSLLQFAHQGISCFQTDTSPLLSIVACPSTSTGCEVPNFKSSSSLRSDVVSTGCIAGYFLSLEGKCVTSCPTGSLVTGTSNSTCTGSFLLSLLSPINQLELTSRPSSLSLRLHLRLLRNLPIPLPHLLRLLPRRLRRILRFAHVSRLVRRHQRDLRHLPSRLRDLQWDGLQPVLNLPSGPTDPKGRPMLTRLRKERMVRSGDAVLLFLRL
jgi:hypothetical protein